MEKGGEKGWDLLFKVIVEHLVVPVKLHLYLSSSSLVIYLFPPLFFLLFIHLLSKGKLVNILVLVPGVELGATPSLRR